MSVAAAVDVLVGVVVGLAGAVVLFRLRRDAVGLLLVVTCAVWFAGSLATVVPTFAMAVQFLHRGVLFHAVLIAAIPFAMVRARGRPSLLLGVAVVIGAGYVVSVVRPLAIAVLPTLLMGVVVAGMVMVRAHREPDRYRTVAWWCTAAGLLLWVAAATVAQWVQDPGASWRVIVYDVGIAVCAVAVSRAVLPRVALPDRALEYADGTVSSVEEALGLALGDRDLRVGFSDAGVFRASSGAVITAGSGQVSTIVDVGPEGEVLLTHRKGLLDDRRVRAEVNGFARMLAEQHRLRERLAGQTAAVRASRDRLRRSEDRAAAVLGTQIEVQVAAGIRELRGQLTSMRQPVTGAVPLVDDILAQLTMSAESLHPMPADQKIAETLQALAARSPIPVDLELADVDVPDAAGRALAFVVSEAMTNAAKHSTSTRITVQLTVDDAGRVVLTVADTGRGGAFLRPGGGLEGLQQRMSGVGGSLVVHSGVGAGTMVSAMWPSGADQPIRSSGPSLIGE